MRSRLFAFGLVILSAALGACGGGGGGGGNPPVNPTPVSSGPTAPPIPPGTQYSLTAVRNVPQPSPAPGGRSAGPIALALPNAPGAVGGSMNLPGQYAVIGSGETVSITLRNQLPSGIRSLTQSAKDPVTPIAYIGLQFSPNPIALEGPPAFTLTIPSGDVLPSADYWIAAYDPTQSSLGWQMAFEGPEAGSATLTFNGGGLFDFAQGSTYWFALYVASSAGATPTPAPTTAPVSFGCTNQPFDVTRRTESLGPRPLASGDTFSYGGSNSTLTQTMSRTQPCPEPTSTAVAGVSDSVTIVPTTAPDHTAQWDMRSAESDAFATNTVSTTTDATVGESASSEFIYGSTVTDTTGNVTATTYATPQTLVKLPETSGNAWTLDPAGTVNEKLVDGTSIARTVAGDGTYSETETTATGGSATISIPAASGAGTYDIPGLATISFAPPSRSTITLTLTPDGGKTQTLTIPAWFGTPVTLYSDASRDLGAVSSLPSWCAPAVSSGNVEQIQETVNLTDPVLGYTEQRGVTTYDDRTYGTVCLSIADTVKEYYDYMLDTPFLLFVSGNGQPYQSNTLSENYVMNSSPVINSRVRRPESQGISPAFVRARVQAIDAIRETERAQRAELMRTYLEHAVRKGDLR